MKLAEFLKLDLLEEQIKNNILKLGINNNSNELDERIENVIYEQIRKINIDYILKISINDVMFNQLCMRSSLKQYWGQLWRQCGPIEPLKIEYLPISTVFCFELLKGIYIYVGYRKLRQEVKERTINFFEEAEKYLTLSADYGCFFALNALSTEGLKLLSTLDRNQLKFEKISNILCYAKKAADLYWTPGYLLLANILQELTLIAENLFEDKILNKKTLFIEAMEALQTAQKLEEYSHAMIHNAYQGKTIKEASDNKIISWFQIKICLQKRAGDLLSVFDINGANIRAKLTVEKILQNIEQQSSLHSLASQLKC